MSAPGYDSYRESGIEWLGKVPAHWNIADGRRVFGQTRVPAKEDDEQLSSTQRYGVIPQQIFMAKEDQKVVLALGGIGNFKHVDKNDFVISLRSFQGGIERCHYSGCVSPAYTVLKPLNNLEPRFWEFLLKSSAYISVLQSVTDGIRDGKTVRYEQFGSVPLPLPPSAEQAAIAAFLDRETGKIDALVEAQTRLIELLKEKRQAVISHAVTKGLDPTAPTKDSGVEWLGQVPAHWVVQTLKRVTETCCDGPFGSGLKSEHYVDEGVRVIRLQNIKERGFDGSDAAYIDYDYFKTTLTRHDVREGDVLIAGLGDERNLVGRACVAPLGIEPAMVKADCFRFRIHPETDTEFLVHQLNAGAAYASGKLATGSTRARIPLSSMMDRIIALPPIAEQREIASELSVWSAKAAELLGQAEAAIILLQERRAALISAAVTGKIDVRGLALEQAEAA